MPAHPQAVVPASGAWREGDPVGDRRFVDLGHQRLEAGGALPGVRLAYETWGTLSPRGDNAVLVEHALTGDSHVTGPPGPGHPTPGWWQNLIGPGQAIDTDRWFVVAPNVLGGCQGSTGPSSAAPDGRPWGSRFPFLTVRALEWGVMHPERVRRLLVLAASTVATADQIAWCAAQLAAIRSDPGFRGGDYYGAADGEGPHAGLGVARRIAHATYRSADELDLRFGRAAQPGERPIGGGGRYAVESYLDHHADKLVHRFDANSYLVLTEAMSSHDVGRSRPSVQSALARVTARTVVASIDSDRLYPLRLGEEIARGVRGCRGLDVVSSPHGHDGFLVETAAVADLSADLLAAAPIRAVG